MMFVVGKKGLKVHSKTSRTSVFLAGDSVRLSGSRRPQAPALAKFFGGEVIVRFSSRSKSDSIRPKDSIIREKNVCSTYRSLQNPRQR